MSTSAPPPAAGRSSLWLVASFAVALLALAGSLWLSLGMRLKACPLCFYQRTFVMGVVTVLGIGALAGRRHRTVLPLLSLPLAVAGLAVAVQHVMLELRGRLECPGGVLGLGTAPQQSAAILALLALLLFVGTVRACRAGESRAAAAAGVLLGLLLAYACVVSSPPMPPAPAAAYPAPPEVCRPPYVPH